MNDKEQALSGGNCPWPGPLSSVILAANTVRVSWVPGTVLSAEVSAGSLRKTVQEEGDGGVGRERTSCQLSRRREMWALPGPSDNP